MQLRLVLELLVVFVGAPLAFDRLLRRGYQWLLFPALWLLAFWALGVLAREPGFDARSLWHVPWDGPDVLISLARSALAVVVLRALARRLGVQPPHEIPVRVRVLIGILYPLLSVVPQGIVWRAFFLQRYAPLFGSGAAMIAASALAFAFAHIIFRNPVALAATLIGGLSFAQAELATGSMLLADLEHAIDGLAVFSLGLGRFLYLGAARARSVHPSRAEHAPGADTADPSDGD